MPVNETCGAKRSVKMAQANTRLLKLWPHNTLCQCYQQSSWPALLSYHRNSHRHLSTVSNKPIQLYNQKSYPSISVFPKKFYSGINLSTRADLLEAKRVIIKLGSAVITREDECGLSLGRLACIIEQVAELQNQGKEMMMVTSGAIAFGKQKLQQEIIMSMSMRQTLTSADKNKQGLFIAPRACAAVGQSGLMSLYEAMFMQYGVKAAQVLITKPDIDDPESCKNLCGTLNELCRLKIIPILNTNDAVAPPPAPDKDLKGVISLKDNDSLSARLAREVRADLMVLMTDVNGIYTGPPGQIGSRLLHTYSPDDRTKVTFGAKSRVGLGGMESKVKAAEWALDNGVATVICNGNQDYAIRDIFAAKKIGTFLLRPRVLLRRSSGYKWYVQTREGSRALQALTGEQRAIIINKLADLLLTRQTDILKANQIDVDKAYTDGVDDVLISRLVLNEKKLKTLHTGLKQIAKTCDSIVGRVTRRTQVAEGLELCQVTAPIGVLMVIFESRPDALPQVSRKEDTRRFIADDKLHRPCDFGSSDMIAKVKIYAGPRMSSVLKFGPPPAVSLHKEYGGLELTMEIVENTTEAVNHINKYSSSHTDVIITDNEHYASEFLKGVDSACVFHNASTRFADGYRFGLGAEVGISTTRIHARGPVGVEGLLTSKWLLQGHGQAAADFADGQEQFIHKSLPLDYSDKVSDSSDADNSTEGQQ
ncbi:ALDH18A1 [Mytilus edulis]|uniref:Delta-1-pyrroline-5-carboxylate synthase n=1 Tax=Mytilus edulis TaxID=6550 RepID=A0A8S3T1Z1_MYTED|nr:ALDH18A1 [Mytilus edulis]